MIDFLRGEISFIESDFVVMDVNGVGYRIFCSNSMEFYSRKGTEQILYIHHHVREDAILLFGFLTREEQSTFRKLLDVSGVGPKVALGILSGGTPAALVNAIQNEDVIYLTKLPGIGKKTAQRIILDLKDKLSFVKLPVGLLTADGAPSARITQETRGGTVGLWNEAKEALIALGYTETELYRIAPTVTEQLSDSDTVDRAIKLALQVLYKQ